MSRERSISRRRFISGAGSAVVGAAISSPAALARGSRGRLKGPADLILHDGHVVTLEQRRGVTRACVAEAVAVKGGIVVDVGTSAAMRRHRGRRTEVIGLQGRSAVAGINDSHLHLTSFGLARPPFQIDVGFPAVRSVSDIRAAIAAAVQELGPGAWVRGRGWNVGDLDEWLADPNWLPTRGDLDPVSPSNPVALTDFGGHAMWVNSVALQLAGITRDTVPPPGGVIVKDAAGEPTGLLLEGARGLVSAIIPPFTADDRRAAMLNAVELLNAEGITSFTDAGTSPDAVTDYLSHVTAGGMTARVSMLLSTGSDVAAVRNAIDGANPLRGIDPRWLQVRGVKLFADGVLTRGTAWMHEPYVGGGPGIEGEHGSLVVSGSTPEEQVQELTEMVRIAHAAGYSVHVHSIGDRSSDAVIDAMVAAMRRHGRRGLRHVIHHGVLFSDGAFDRLRRHGIGVNMQATITFIIADVIASMVGEERGARQSAFATCVAHRVPMMLSSDMPVSSINWRQGVSTAMLREPRQGGAPIGPAETISFAQALRAYTIDGAWQDHAERWKGNVVRGMTADLCVVEDDVTRTSARDLPGLAVDMTILDGRVVYERSSAGRIAKVAAAESARRPSGEACCCCLGTDDAHAHASVSRAELDRRTRDWHASLIDRHRAAATRT
jgi:predicted amidohydrolase YtcJ